MSSEYPLWTPPIVHSVLKYTIWFIHICQCPEVAKKSKNARTYSCSLVFPISLIVFCPWRSVLHLAGPSLGLAGPADWLGSGLLPGSGQWGCLHGWTVSGVPVGGSPDRLGDGAVRYSLGTLWVLLCWSSLFIHWCPPTLTRLGVLVEGGRSGLLLPWFCRLCGVFINQTNSWWCFFLDPLWTWRGRVLSRCWGEVHRRGSSVGAQVLWPPGGSPQALVDEGPCGRDRPLPGWGIVLRGWSLLHSLRLDGGLQAGVRSVIVHCLCDSFGNDSLIFTLNNCWPHHKVKFVSCDGVVAEEVGVKGWFPYNLGNKVHGLGLHAHIPCDLHTPACVLDHCRLSHVVEVQELGEHLLQKGLRVKKKHER